jgi:hypothetical protein
VPKVLVTVEKTGGDGQSERVELGKKQEEDKGHGCKNTNCARLDDCTGQKFHAYGEQRKQGQYYIQCFSD